MEGTLPRAGDDEYRDCGAEGLARLPTPFVAPYRCAVYAGRPLAATALLPPPEAAVVAVVCDE